VNTIFYNSNEAILMPIGISGPQGAESGLETTLRSNAARWKAREGLADFGICLITVESGKGMKRQLLGQRSKVKVT